MKKIFTKLCLACLMLGSANTAMAYNWKFGDDSFKNYAMNGGTATFKADIEDYDWTNSDATQQDQLIIIMDLSRCVSGTRENLFTIGHTTDGDFKWNVDGYGDSGTGTKPNTSQAKQNGWNSSMFLHVDFTNGDDPTFTLRFNGTDYTVKVKLPDIHNVVFSFSNGGGLRINSVDACWINETNMLTKCLMYNQSDGRRVFFANSGHKYGFFRYFGNPNHATYKTTYKIKKAFSGTTNLSDQTEYTEDWVKAHLGQQGAYKIMRTFEANTWYTFCMPMDLGNAPFKQLMGNAKVRHLTSIDGNTLVFSEKTDHYFYGEPVLICPSTRVETPSYNQRINNFGPMTSTVTNTDGESVQFVGTWSRATLNTGGKELFLGEGGKFYEPTATDNIMPGLRAYLKLPETMDAQMLKVSIDGVETSIGEIENGELLKSCDTRVFNLQGQLVGNTLKGLQPGIYVQGGKKVSVK